MTTWHRWHGTRALIACGSCGMRMQAGRVFARVHVPMPPPRQHGSRDVMPVPLVRCEDCWERMQIVCPWPKHDRVFEVEDAYAVPAPTLPGVMRAPVTQPFAPLRKSVEDFKARQMKDAS